MSGGVCKNLGWSEGGGGTSVFGGGGHLKQKWLSEVGLGFQKWLSRNRFTQWHLAFTRACLDLLGIMAKILTFLPGAGAHFSRNRKK